MFIFLLTALWVGTPEGLANPDAEDPAYYLLRGRESLGNWKNTKYPEQIGLETGWEWVEPYGAHGALRTCGNWCGSIETLERFRDFFLHVEFKSPNADSSFHEQLRGNSGIYLQGRYELQVLESYGATIEGKNDLGAIYGVADPIANAALPPATWQAYDIEFKAARFTSEGIKAQNAQVTVWLNGVLVQNALVLLGSTEGGDAENETPGPIRLQDHDPFAQVEYRNIWVKRL